MSRVSIAELTALARDKSAPIDVRLGRLLTLGDALAETGSLNKAAKTFELAVKLKPDSHGAYYYSASRSAVHITPSTRTLPLRTRPS